MRRASADLRCGVGLGFAYHLPARRQAGGLHYTGFERKDVFGDGHSLALRNVGIAGHARPPVRNAERNRRRNPLRTFPTRELSPVAKVARFDRRERRGEAFAVGVLSVTRGAAVGEVQLAAGFHLGAGTTPDDEQDDEDSAPHAGAAFYGAGACQVAAAANRRSPVAADVAVHNPERTQDPA